MAKYKNFDDYSDKTEGEEVPDMVDTSGWSKEDIEKLGPGYASTMPSGSGNNNVTSTASGNELYDAYNFLLNNKPESWDGGAYGYKLSKLLNQIDKREDFSYDLNSDMLYQQYKDQYMTQGKLAMADSIGQASAMTGGYGNSYAATVGNQQYQSYLQQLNDVVPELYNLAYSKYNQEGQDLYNQASLYNQMYNQEYGEYQDRVNEYYQQLQNAYNAYTDDRDYNEGVRQYEENMAENKRQFDLQYNLSLANKGGGGTTNGYTDEDRQFLLNAYLNGQTGVKEKLLEAYGGKYTIEEIIAGTGNVSNGKTIGSGTMYDNVLATAQKKAETSQYAAWQYLQSIANNGAYTSDMISDEEIEYIYDVMIGGPDYSDPKVLEEAMHAGNFHAGSKFNLT